MCLPRSRSAWLAHFLSYGGIRCGHDALIDCAKIKDFTDLFGGKLDGTVETGAVVGWRVLRKLLPKAKIAIIRRDVDDVAQSLARVGIFGPAVMEELLLRDAGLDMLECEPDVLSVPFEALASPEACCAIWEHLLPVPFDWEWWGKFAPLNIQVSIGQRVALLRANAQRISLLKAEVAAIASMMKEDASSCRLH